MNVLAPVPAVDNRLFVPEWERRERARLEANRRDECGQVKPPDPGASRHTCGYVTGSRGCLNTCGNQP